MTRPSLEITLPDSLRRFVEQQVARGHYGDSATYVREVLTREQLRQARAEVEERLLEAFEGPFADVSAADFADIRAAVRP